MALALDTTATGGTGAAGNYTATLSTSGPNRFLAACTFSTGVVTGISDTAGLTWTKRAVAGAGSLNIAYYYAIASSTLSSDVITVAIPSADYGNVIVFSISGAATVPFDSNASVPATETNSNPLVISTTSSNDLIFGFYVSTGGNTPATPGSGWTSAATATHYPGGSEVQYQIVTAPQANLSIAKSGGNGTIYGIGDAIVAAAAASSVYPFRRNRSYLAR